MLGTYREHGQEEHAVWLPGCECRPLPPPALCRVSPSTGCAALVGDVPGLSGGVHAAARRASHAPRACWRRGTAATPLCVPCVRGPALMSEAHDQVKYWAIDSGCCSGEEATCDGWDEQDFQGINWWKSERPRTVFLQDKHLGVDITALGEIIKTKTDLPGIMPVVVEWRKNASADVRGQFDAPAWTWLVVVTLFWPLVLCLLWTAVTLGSCLFLPRSFACSACPLCCLPHPRAPAGSKRLTALRIAPQAVRALHAPRSIARELARACMQGMQACRCAEPTCRLCTPAYRMRADADGMRHAGRAGGCGRMHCHQPLNTYCLYVGSGCPSCWSELDLVD